MRTSYQGLVAIAGHEGIVTSRYKDSVGVWTIGVGHTSAAGGINPAKYMGTISVEVALQLFLEDIKKYEDEVNKAVKVKLTQYEFDALVSFHYNTGAIAKATLTKSLNAGNKKQAAAEFMNWLKPKEITARRQAEKDLFLTGKYPKPEAAVYPANANGAVQWSKGKKADLGYLLKDVGIPSEKPVESVPEVPVVIVPVPTPTPPSESPWAKLIEAILKLFGAKDK